MASVNGRHGDDNIHENDAFGGADGTNDDGGDLEIECVFDGMG